MAAIESITEAMLKQGCLTQENLVAAKAVLAKHLSATDRQKYYELRADSGLQEKMILGDRPYAERDAERGDQKSLKVDRMLIQGARNQDEVDLFEMQALEGRIAKQVHRAAKALVSAELVSRRNQSTAVELIQQTWMRE